DARSAYRGREQQACSPSLTGSARGKRALPIRPVEQEWAITACAVAPSVIPHSAHGRVELNRFAVE
ncbi:MAG: hypothetical protein WA705_30160, partial [Candidatus Ozemobacteraceae bacterium]